MANNTYYWENKLERSKKAKIWTDKMEYENSDLIYKSVKETKLYTYALDTPVEKTDEQNIHLMDTDTVSAICYLAEQGVEGKMAALNFASFKNPGGMFLKGSRAQEECLCHESFLFNVLCRFEKYYYEENRKHLNKSMYENRALYTPDIHFYRDQYDVLCDVITCAAPNFSAGNKYCGVTREYNDDALRKRIRFIMYIAKDNGVKNLILGAYGCGVFGQNPNTVADIMQEALKEYKFENVIFAIPNKNDSNYKAFAEVFK